MSWKIKKLTPGVYQSNYIGGKQSKPLLVKPIQQVQSSSTQPEEPFVSTTSSFPKKNIYVAFYKKKRSEMTAFGALRHQIECKISDGFWDDFCFSHAEFVVEHELDPNQYWAFGINNEDSIIHQHDNKKWENKAYDTPTVVGFMVTYERYDHAMKWIAEAMVRGDGFDHDYWMHFVPTIFCCLCCCGCCGLCMRQKSPKKLWYCSELTSEILYQLGIFGTGEFPSPHITPQQLFDQCLKRGGIVLSIQNVLSTIGKTI